LLALLLLPLVPPFRLFLRRGLLLLLALLLRPLDPLLRPRLLGLRLLLPARSPDRAQLVDAAGEPGPLRIAPIHLVPDRGVAPAAPAEQAEDGGRPALQERGRPDQPVGDHALV